MGSYSIQVNRTKTMNPLVKTKWLEALRSGFYDQDRGRLRTEAGFCCLGVLCDLYAEDHKDVHWTKSAEDPKDVHWTTSYVEGEYTFLGSEGTLPQPVVYWAGLKSSSPSVSYENDTCELAELNDSLNLSFDEIADVIEEQL